MPVGPDATEPAISRRRHECRGATGFSIVTVILIGLVSTLWIAALFGTILPSYHKVSNTRTQSSLRYAAEAAADWAVAQLQNTSNNAFDDPDPSASTSVRHTVPSQNLGYYGNVPVTATVEVNNTRPPATTYLYDPHCDDQIQPLQGGNGWRILTVNARLGGSDSHASKTIRVILKPNYVPGANIAPYSPQAAILVDGALSLNGNGMRTDSYDSRLSTYGGSSTSDTEADVFSNGHTTGTPIDLGNSEIGGSVIVAKQPGMSTSRTDVTSGSHSVVSQGILVNGLSDFRGTARGLGTPPQVDTDQSMPGHQTLDSWADHTIRPSLNIPDVTLPPVPAPPANAINIPAITSSRTLTAGDYVAPHISLTGTKTLTIEGTVRIWVQGGNPSFLDLGGHGAANSSGLPKNLQVYYAGEHLVNLRSNGEFRGVLYAPNAPVALRSNGQFYGSVTAKSMTLNGVAAKGGFHFDRSLKSVSLFIGGDGSTTWSRRAVVSWEEFDNRADLE